MHCEHLKHFKKQMFSSFFIYFILFFCVLRICHVYRWWQKWFLIWSHIGVSCQPAGCFGMPNQVTRTNISHLLFSTNCGIFILSFLCQKSSAFLHTYVSVFGIIFMKTIHPQYQHHPLNYKWSEAKLREIY